MVAHVLLVLTAAAQQLPRAQADVDRTSIEVGDDVVLTVRLDAYGSQSVEVIGQPPLSGLQLRGTSQSSNLSLRDGGGVRTTIWEYTLRGVAPGRAVIGPIRLRAGVEEIRVDALTVEVRAVDAANRDAIDARIADIVQNARGPDGTDEVRVSVVPWPDSIVLGEQVDLVVVAWFPRDTRTRLRTRPTLTPPELQGAWSYAQTSALGVVATREFSGRLYDLFVHHQVVFPLTAGVLEVGPARVAFSIPIRQSILSREQPREVESRPTSVYVADQPLAGQPTDFDGVAAADMQLVVQVDSGGFAAGEVASLTATLHGKGNVALWPEPEFAWPAGLRVYPGNTSMEVNTVDGFVVGSKTFNYVLVADSVGSFTVPAPRLAYYDSDRGRYRVVSASPVTLVSRIRRDDESLESTEIPLMESIGQPGAERIVLSARGWAWILVGAAPPLLALMAIWAGRRRRRPSNPDVSDRRSGGLGNAADDFYRALKGLVPKAEFLNREQLSAALEAAGVEVPLAAQTARVRDRIRKSVYGPPHRIDADELRAEVTEILRALPGRAERYRGFVNVAVALLLVPPMATVGLAGQQAPSAEQLYDAGGYEQAADSFAHRTSAFPDEPAHWVNLGAALYSSGNISAARAAWLRAARQVPRNQNITSALNQLPRLDSQSDGLTWVSPVTVAESVLVASVCWIIGWLLLGLRQTRLSVMFGVIAVVSGGYAWYVHSRYREPIGLVMQPNTPLRAAPYGPAAPLRLLNEDTAVQLVRTDGAWVFVQRSDVRGWLLASEVARF